MGKQEELLQLEQKIVDEVGGGWKSDVTAFKAQVIKLAAMVEGKDMTSILPQVRELLQALNSPGGMTDKAIQGVHDAHQVGVSSTIHAQDEVPPKVPISAKSTSAVEGLDDLVESAMKKSIDNIGRELIGGGITGLLTALAPVLQTPNKIDVATAWAVNNSSNEAVFEVAKVSKQTTVWIPETDACVDCTAYAGVRSTSEGFPSGLTYGDPPSSPPDDPFIEHPPLHPRCRCSIEVNITDDYADALKREGVRSILRGISMDSESDKVRVDAAQRLLDQNPVAPASVQKYAERAIKAGTFND